MENSDFPKAAGDASAERCLSTARGNEFTGSGCVFGTLSWPQGAGLLPASRLKLGCGSSPEHLT